MRKNGTLTAREQTAALAKIDAELTTIRAALAEFMATHAAMGYGPVSDVMGTAWNALNDAETALRAEHRRVSLNTPASAVERMMANVD